MAKELRKLIARSTHTRAGTLCSSHVPAATASYCQRGGVYSGGWREWRGRVKSRRREDGRLGRRVRPRHDGEVPPGATCNARGASDRTWSRGRGGVEGNPPTPSVSPGRVDFSGINGSSSSSNSNDREDLPELVGRFARDLEIFGELPTLQSEVLNW